MGNGQLTYVPSFSAVQFDEGHYLELNSADSFNINTYDFRLAVLFWPDSTVSSPAADKYLISKWDGDLANDMGYVLYYNPTSGLIGFGINDGDATPGTATGSGKITNNAWNLVVVEADRSGNAVIYVNGVAAATGDISGKTGSANNAHKLTFSHGNTFKGLLGYLMLTFGPGKILGADYALEEYYRIIWGGDRSYPAGSGYYVWQFNNSLADDRSAYTFTYGATGSPTYTTGYPVICYLTFEHNFDFNYELDYLPLDNLRRGLDGTGLMYLGPQKRRALLTFATMTTQQRIALESAWHCCRNEVYFYRDVDRPFDFKAIIAEPFKPRQLAYGLYQGELLLEEA